MLDYHLSSEADHDLEDIFDYTNSEFGTTQAFEYVSSFDKIFENLCSHPFMGRERNEIRSGLRSIVNERHVIFYRLLKKEIRIVRILHGSKDLPRNFQDIF